MDASITIRLAHESDAPRLARLRYDFRSEMHPTTESDHEFAQRCESWMAERLRDGSRWRCWVAERQYDLVGGLWVQLIEKIPNPSDEPEEHAYISNVYVRDVARGSGIGSALLDAALAWCDERPVHSVILWPSVRSRPLYERFGFTFADGILERPGGVRRTSARPP